VVWEDKSKSREAAPRETMQNVAGVASFEF
jgi:hypothetical protein